MSSRATRYTGGMVNPVALQAMLAQLEHAVALAGAILWGYAAGRPVKRAIIRKWAKHG